MSLKVIPEPFSLGGARARRVSNALADVLCWFAGFKAGQPDAQLPPGLEELRSLNIKLKDTWEESDD